MSQAKDLLTSILSSASGGQIQAGQALASDSTLLSATTVTKPPPIVSVQTFNAQLSIGGKDEALRKASKLFRTAAESMGRSQTRGEMYWVDALRARRANWGLSPAPLPPGSAMGKGADKTSKDFIISYGLEGCACLNKTGIKMFHSCFSAPPSFRHRAIAQMPTVGQQLVFPFHQNTRLRTSLSFVNGSRTDYSTFTAPNCLDDMDLDVALKNAQIEIANQEIFSLLVAEAGNLPTASVQVAERLIIISAAQGLELTFELVRHSFNFTERSSNST
jgi:mediator of RNA polymerase II transcription subunit 17